MVLSVNGNAPHTLSAARLRQVMSSCTTLSLVLSSAPTPRPALDTLDVRLLDRIFAVGGLTLSDMVCCSSVCRRLRDSVRQLSSPGELFHNDIMAWHFKLTTIPRHGVTFEQYSDFMTKFTM